MSGEKTEQPTHKRLEDQRKEGQLPQRKNVVEAGLVTFAVLLLIGISGPLWGSLVTLSTTVFSGVDRDFDAARASSFAAAMDVVYLVLAVCVLVSMVTLLFGLLLNRFNFAPKALSPKFQKFNPVNQIKGIFSKATIYNFIRLLVYFSIIATLLYLVIANDIENAINASHCGWACLYPFFVSRFKIVVAVILIVLVLLAALDFRIQTLLFTSQNKMAKDEVKREHKGQEGDPEIKAGRKSVAMNDAAMPLLSDATHVVHSDQVLVAIIFYPAARQRPYVVFKAKGASVAGLCRKFRGWKVPTFNIPTVALDFYRMATPGQYMPARSAKGMSRILQASGGG
ncbi:EscU/YscU/HrcU family type III secretion system export apparatus switch protein [Kaustia mangrovi]|uniref:EscU/YscU/HrcU family type III secretion system export apparatus switch protein n=1 Tax=Kaustia mangrovi TaxID=2593653 RepID=A0A7S8HD55_9HYPH|nr:EscU/YscU/HrcU family type III secretion system export apparatus switch protein [Kaustia mangrovi]QPC44326.1 EscU/YscU/HrcU family type III secretion system export apparatus switch protein [Kaustia mangrovi]